MKQIPILFSTPMVQSILAGRKTQTRRILDMPKDEITDAKWGFTIFTPDRHISFRGVHADDQYGESFVKMKWCKGDMLYVREGYYQYGKWGIADKLTKKGRLKREFIPLDEEIIFATEGTKTIVDGAEFNLPVEKNSHILPAWYKRLPRFMPKKYARIWLQVEDVRVERLQDISHDDAIAEGIGRWTEERMRSKPTHYEVYYREPGDDSTHSSCPIVSYQTLWQQINGPESWAANPWVWVISFKVLSTTGKPDLNGA